VEARPDSTLVDVRPGAAGPRRTFGRRLGVALLVIVVGAGAAGLLGVRSATAHGTGGGYRLTVTYPRVARSGLDTPFRLSVHRAGGFDRDIVLRLNASYLHMFETQGFAPEPSDETADGRWLYLTFTPPASAADFTVDYDAYIQPGSQIGKHGSVAVMAGTDAVASASFHTWLVP